MGDKILMKKLKKGGTTRPHRRATIMIELFINFI